VDGKTDRHRNNDLAQRLLLKALSEGITDPKDMKKIAGLRTAADVYRTLDKMSLRREYHEALSRCGIDFDYLIGGIKKICDKSDSDKVRLKGFEMLLRSVGLDKYDKIEDTSKNWEDTIIKLSEDGTPMGKSPTADRSDYTVDTPLTPPEEAKKRAEEQALAESFYE